jgi:hypothetical protein
MSKIVTFAAAACGYVLGARAGRERYEQIRDRAQSLWRDPRVQEKTDQAAAVIKDKAAPAVKEGMSKAAKQVTEKTRSNSTTNQAGEKTKSNSSANQS